jgi:hypothetical protein
MEENRPDLVSETHEMWFSMIKRDVFGWEKMLLSKVKRNGENWTLDEIKKKATATTYRNCMAKARKEEDKATEILRQAIAKETQDARERETRIVDKVPSSWEKPRHSSSTSRPKSDIISKIRREAAAHRQTQPGGSLSTPNHLLQVRRRPQIIRAPQMRRLLEPAKTLARAATKSGEEKTSTVEKSHVRANSDGASSTNERSKPSGTRPSDSRGEARTTPKRKRVPTVLLPSKRMK